MNWVKVSSTLLVLGVGVVIGITVGLFILSGVSAASVLFGGLGVAILVGQLALGYRQARGEAESRTHELRVRNEDLFATHARALAEQSLQRLQNAWVSNDPPQIQVYRLDQSGTGEPIDGLPNWDYALTHLLQEPGTGGRWKEVERAFGAYKQAAREWDTEFTSQLTTQIEAELGPGWEAGKPWGRHIPERGFDPELVRQVVRWGEDGTPLSPLNVGPSGRNLFGIGLATGTGFFAKSGATLQPAKVEKITSVLVADESLSRLRRIEDDSAESAASKLLALRSDLKLFAERVHLSGRLPGDCAVCAPLQPRISRE